MSKKDKVEIPQLKLTFKVNNLRLTEKQKIFLALALQEETNIMFVSGPAGSTKTYMAVYAALRHLSADDDLDMFYVRTVIESADKGLGALPGSVEEKINPYMAPLEDKLMEMLPQNKTVRRELIDSGRIQAMPINFLRGASWKDKVVVADEAQNFTFKELTTLITRLGHNSKLFICGDFMQSDINGKSGYADMFNLFKDQESQDNGIHCFSFNKNDILRSELQKYIIGKLEDNYKK
jgi:phosphate starvation-inducible PhoH-like protein|tara:strand:- start:34080 stop:34787 length:708 start_codon:yes stop_codon:yes gene_type:complete